MGLQDYRDRTRRERHLLDTWSFLLRTVSWKRRSRRFFWQNNTTNCQQVLVLSNCDWSLTHCESVSRAVEPSDGKDKDRCFYSKIKGLNLTIVIADPEPQIIYLNIICTGGSHRWVTQSTSKSYKAGDRLKSKNRIDDSKRNVPFVSSASIQLYFQSSPFLPSSFK